MPCKRSHSRSGQPVNAICSNQTSREEDLTKPQSMRAPTADHFHRGLAAVVSLAVGGAFLALWFWLLPGWLGPRAGDGWPQFRRRWDLRSPHAASGTSVGRDVVRLPPSFRRKNWWWSGSIDTYVIPCTWALRQDGSACGSSSGIPIHE